MIWPLKDKHNPIAAFIEFLLVHKTVKWAAKEMVLIDYKLWSQQLRLLRPYFIKQSCKLFTARLKLICFWISFILFIYDFTFGKC